MAEEDDTTYRIIRRSTPRLKRDTQPSTPKALADGSGEVFVTRDELGDLATPVASFGGLPMRGRPTTIPPMAPAVSRATTGQLRDGTLLEFGNTTIRVRHHGGVVHIELSDGTRLSGSDAQACELASVLLRAGARRP